MKFQLYPYSIDSLPPLQPPPLQPPSPATPLATYGESILPLLFYPLCINNTTSFQVAKFLSGPFLRSFFVSLSPSLTIPYLLYLQYVLPSLPPLSGHNWGINLSPLVLPSLYLQCTPPPLPSLNMHLVPSQELFYLPFICFSFFLAQYIYRDRRLHPCGAVICANSDHSVPSSGVF